MRRWPAVLVAGAIVLAGCTSRSGDGNLQVLRVWEQDDVKSFDPANAYDSISLDVLPNIQETLYQHAYLSEQVKVIPLLAADMPRYSKDRLTLTIPLKRGVRFQDDPCFKDTQGKGRELKAGDFVYAIKRLALPWLRSTGWWLVDGKLAGINAFHEKFLKAPKLPQSELAKLFDQEVEGIRALDDYTLQLKLVKPYPQLLYALAMTFTSPVAREAVERYGDENGNLTEHPVGTGPFVLTKWDRGRRIVLDRNPNHHEEFYPTEASLEFLKRGLTADAGRLLPFLDRIAFDIIRERQPAWLTFMQGGLDLISLPKDNFQQAISHGSSVSPELAARGIRLNVETGASFYYIGFNTKDKLLANKTLRQALASAIDRDRWIELFTNGTGRKMTHLLPPGLADRPKETRLKFDHSVDTAKALLKKAGYPGGQGLPPLTFDMSGADSLSRQYGDFFTRQFAEIGVKINVVYNTFPAYLEKSKRGDLQIYFAGWVLDYPDAENVFQLLYGPNRSPGPNDAGFDHPELNKLYEQMTKLEPGPKRAALIRKMDELVQEEAPWAYGYYHAYYELYQPWLQNFRGGGLIVNRYKYLRINREIKKRYQESR